MIGIGNLRVVLRLAGCSGQGLAGLTGSKCRHRWNSALSWTLPWTRTHQLSPAQTHAHLWLVTATSTTPRIGSIRSLAADRSVTRIDPDVGEELQRAWRYLRAAGDSQLSRKDLASEAIAGHLDALRESLGVREEWPEANLSLFEMARPARTGRSQLAQGRRVPLDRQHTKVPGELLDHARAAVEYRRARGEADLTLLDWIGNAMAAQLAAEAAQLSDYPSLDEALQRRYGPP